MSKLFTTVKKSKPKRSNFNLSEEMKLSCNFGQIIPICVKETLPGDKFKINTELLVKFAPLKAPVMHRIKVKVDYFYVPLFQLTSQFEKFINPKINDPIHPSVILPYFTPKSCLGNSTRGSVGSLADYMGLPISQTSWKSNSEDKLSIFPFAAYQHIYNSFFRDENAEKLPSEGGPQVTSSTQLLYDPLTYKDFQGDISTTGLTVYQLPALFALRTCCWKKDYFTSALPSPQAGDDVMLPISTSTQIAADGKMIFRSDGDEDNYFAAQSPELSLRRDSDNNSLGYLNSEDVVDSEGDPTDGDLKYAGGLKGLSTNAGISINNLRKLFSLQRFKELSERGGTRYIEVLRNFFAETAPDLYFDRPMYLGGYVQPIQIGETVQTSETTLSGTAGFAQGTRAGLAHAYGKTKTVSFRARFHGYVIGVLRIIPEATYSQGVERMWTRQSIFDFAWPQFANIGEQEIKNKEIFANGDSHDDEVFGYTPRYAEYKEGHCHIAGEFRTSLDYWHFGRTFANLPALNKSFLNMDTMDYDPFNVISSQNEHVYVNLYNTIYCKRNLPYYGTPSLL